MATLATLLSLPLVGQQAQQPTTPPPATNSDDDVIVLTPFQVTSEKDQGYYAENTLAGSRLRTNIADLASSISVVTLQQIEDTASTDINDIFRFEANTEGSLTYTPSIQSLRNDGVVDVNAGFTHGGSAYPQTNATANRVRGIGIPGAAINFYPAIGNVPFDTYNIQSIEISRGPNSLLFGMGSPAGIVNSSTANAIIGRDAASITLRTDSNSSRRASLTFNKHLIDDKLAIMGAFLYDEKRFQRKPSYDDTDRQYGAITFQPFPKTVIRANIERYNNDNRRPNSLTPRDGVSEWRSAGSPAYDPTTGMIYVTATGEVKGPLASRTTSPRVADTRAYIMSRPDYNPALHAAGNTWTSYDGQTIVGSAAVTNANSILYTPGLSFITQSRPIQTVADGQLLDYFYSNVGRYATMFGTATNPAGTTSFNYPAESVIFADPALSAAYDTLYTQSGFWSATGNGVGSYRYPGVSNKSIYDWENINLLQMNSGHDENMTYNVEIEQRLLDNLFLSLGWFKQDFESLTYYTVSQLNVATLFVDTNLKLPDGRVNPYFGQPYFLDFDPDKFYNAEINESYRAQLAFTPDFTNRDGWMKWLGRHQMLGLWSRNESLTTLIRYRMEHTDSSQQANNTILFQPNPNIAGWGHDRNGRSVQRWYYLGSPGNQPYGSVSQASGENPVNEGHTGPMQYFNWDSGWNTLNSTTEYVPHNASTGRGQRFVDSLNFGTTSYFWNDRIIATFGVRKDKYKARRTTDGAITDGPNGNVITPALANEERWVNGLYQVDQQFARWNYWDRLEGTTRTTGVVFRPFQNWEGIDRRAAEGSLFNQFIQSLGFSYNESDNFNPPPSAQVDNFGNALPKPTGEGKDYGFQFALFDNKLFARVNWFEATNENERTPPGTSVSRFNLNVDRDTFRAWARTIALINMGFDPRLENWDQGANVDAVETAAEAIWQLPYDYYDNLNVGTTRSAEAEGMEVQVTYNPSRNWTMKFTAGRQETAYANVLNEWQEWYDVRYPIWQAARAADYLLPQYQSLATYTTFGGTPVSLTNFLSSYGYVSQARLGEPNGNENVQLYYDAIVTPQVAVARDLDGQAAPGQRQWRWSFLSNYQFTEGALRGFSIGGSVRWEDKAVIGYRGKINPGSGSNDLVLSDVNQPFFDDEHYYWDFFLSYSRKIWDNKVNMKIQVNLNNAFEGGGLQLVGRNYDESPNSYRIIDPRLWVVQTKFEF